MKPFLIWCQEQKIRLNVNWVKSEEMQADSLSRWQYDRGDYTLNRDIFLQIQRYFSDWIQPDVDMFASPGNRQLPLFLSRWPHWEALACNALDTDLTGIHNCYANPPWNLIWPWLI